MLQMLAAVAVHVCGELDGGGDAVEVGLEVRAAEEGIGAISCSDIATRTGSGAPWGRAAKNDGARDCGSTSSRAVLNVNR
jgi:hypothetical protein